MIRFRPHVLILMAVALGAEETPPAPTPAVTASEAPPAPSAGGTDPKAGDVAPAPRDVTGFTGRRSADERAFFGSVSLGGGYDSNALLLEEANDPIDRLSGSSFSGTLTAGWRALRSNDHHLTVAGTIQHEQFPDQEQADLWRYGGLVTYGTVWGPFIPGATAGVNRYILDGEGTATSYAGSLSLNRATRSWASLPAIEVLHLDYDEFTTATGTLIAGYYRHWFMLEPGNPRRRIELGLRAGTYTADAETESYLTIRPTATILWRIGSPRSTGCWELAARAGYEYRAYDEIAGGQSEEEVSHAIGAGIDADRWFNRWLSAGGYLRGSLRESNIPSRDYDRGQIGLRLTASY